MNFDKLIKKIKEDCSIAYVLVTCILFITLILMPVLFTGYAFDDSHDTLIKGFLIEANDNIIHFNFVQILGWFSGLGRFIPLQFYFFPYFDLIYNLYLYKITIIALIIIDICLFCYLIYLITGLKSLSVLPILLIPAFFQMRLYHDPLSGAHFLMPLIFLEIILSIIFLVFHLKTEKMRHLVLSVLLFGISIVTYEIVYPFVILYLLIIIAHSYENEIRKFKIAILSFISMPFLTLLIPHMLQIRFGLLKSGYQDPNYRPNIDMFAAFTAFIKQTIAAFPLSYYILDPNQIFRETTINVSAFIAVSIILITLLWFSISKNIPKLITCDQKNIEHSINNVKLILLSIGISFLLFPSILIALSVKYQNELIFGIGYIPVFFSYFGIVLLIVLFICILYDKNKNHNIKHVIKIINIISLIFLLLTIFTYYNNWITIRESNDEWLYPRNLIEDGINNGLLDIVPKDSIFIIDNVNPWDQPAFYHMMSQNKNSTILSSYKLKSYLKAGNSGYISNKLPNSSCIKHNYTYVYNFKEKDHVYYLRYYAYNNNYGYIILGKINQILLSNNDVYDVSCNLTYVYLASNKKDANFSNDVITFYSLNNSSDRLSCTIDYFHNNTFPLWQGNYWKIIEIVNNESFNTKQLGIIFSLDNPKTDLYDKIFSESNQIYYFLGFYPREVWSGVTTRWMADKGALVIYSNDNQSKKLQFNTRSFLKPRTLSLSLNKREILVSTIPTEFKQVTIPLNLQKGENILDINILEGSERPIDIPELSIWDGRNLSIVVQNVKICN